MDQKNCTDINIIASDDNPVNRQAALNILLGMGYTNKQITEIAVSQSTQYDAETCGAGGSKNAPAKASFIYIGAS